MSIITCTCACYQALSLLFLSSFSYKVDATLVMNVTSAKNLLAAPDAKKNQGEGGVGGDSHNVGNGGGGSGGGAGGGGCGGSGGGGVGVGVGDDDVKARLLLPFELKTGKRTHISHRAQVILYTLLLGKLIAPLCMHAFLSFSFVFFRFLSFFFGFFSLLFCTVILRLNFSQMQL
jgi:hypothetical protein